MPSVGFINPFLYEYAAKFQMDITYGNSKCSSVNFGGMSVGEPNSTLWGMTCCDVGFYASTGWDPVTGIGGVNFTSFVTALLDVVDPGNSSSKPKDPNNGNGNGGGDGWVGGLSPQWVFITVGIVVCVLISLMFVFYRCFWANKNNNVNNNERDRLSTMQPSLDRGPGHGPGLEPDPGPGLVGRRLQSPRELSSSGLLGRLPPNNPNLSPIAHHHYHNHNGFGVGEAETLSPTKGGKGKGGGVYFEM
jgi:hypothetical protein